MEFSFVSMPNLPLYSVKTVLIGEKYANILGKIFAKQGISVISIPENPDIAPEIAFHADMSVCHIGENRIVAAHGVFDELKKRIPSDIQLLKAGKLQKEDYPDDIGLNVCIIGDKLLHNLKHTDPVIALETKILGLNSFNINQGYTKCSICVLRKDKIITSDKGIHELALKLGVASLLIRSGSIKLDGYDTGFIGGSCGKLSENKIAFTGKLNEHPDEEKILNFISEANIEVIYLSDVPVFDIGSIIPIQENAD